MLPRLWLSGKDVQSDLDLRTIRLPTAVKVTAVVLDPRGAALAHANVRLYTIAPGCYGAADPSTCMAPPRLRAEGSSSSGGLVDFILPSAPRP
jgi:hypothetical protein